MRTPPPVILHVPHASTLIPDNVRSQFALNDEELHQELGLITDHFTDELFQADESKATTITFPISRIVVDPERFEDDAQEPMSKRGMGVVYTRTTQQAPLRGPLPNGEREFLIERYYRPHHAKLTAAVNAALALHNCCLIIDAHSFPAVPLPYELDQDRDRPDFCIGTDPFHTPESIALEAQASFLKSGYTVTMNRPFAGSLVPLEHYGRDKRVLSVMIEVNRSIYLDPPTEGVRSSDFVKARTAVQDCLKRLTAIVGNLR